MRSVVGDERYREMCDLHISIPHEKVPPHGQYIARYRIFRAGQQPTKKTLYGSGTRVHADTDEARRAAIWRVYTVYVRPECVARDFLHAADSDADSLSDCMDDDSSMPSSEDLHFDDEDLH